MPAHVERRMDAAIVSPDDNDGFIGDLADEIITRVGYATHRTGTEPVVRKNFLYISIEAPWIRVELALKRPFGRLFRAGRPPCT